MFTISNNGQYRNIYHRQKTRRINNIIFSPWSKREIYNDIRISEIYFIHSIHIFDMEEIYNDIRISRKKKTKYR